MSPESFWKKLKIVIKSTLGYDQRITTHTPDSRETFAIRDHRMGAHFFVKQTFDDIRTFNAEIDFVAWSSFHLI